MDTVVLPTPPTSGAILTSSDKGYGTDFFATWAGIEATNRNGAMNLKAIGDASVAEINATNLSGVSVTKNVTDAAVAGINATNLNGVSVTKNVTDGTVSGLNATNLSAVATQKAISDSALANALAFGEVRNNIAESATAAALSSKDIQIAIFKDGAHTREETQEAICELAKDTAKGFADIALQACKDNAALALQAERIHAATAAQIAKCCCEAELREKDTQALIIKQSSDAIKDELQEARFEILALKNRHHDK